MRQTSAIPSKLPPLIAALLALAFLVTAGVGESWAAEKTTLLVKRNAALGRAFAGMEVYVNDERLGKVKNGEVAEFKFEARKKNVLFLKIPGGLTDAKSREIVFSKPPFDGPVAAVATYRANILGDSLEVKLIAGRED